MKFYDSDTYQTRCQERFEHYQRAILTLNPNANVEHIGASSIPGAVSKGDLDIFVGVDAADFDSTIQKLKSLNVREKQNTLRTEALCMLESLQEDIALQVVVKGSEFEFFLSFRDQLRTHPKLVQEYNELKWGCTGLSQDEYRSRKSAFIERVLSSITDDNP